MPVTGICIELRPNICSGVAFLQFDRSLADRLETRLVIKEHGVHILEENGNSDGLLVVRYGTFGMDIHQLSVFHATNEHVSFRFKFTHIDLEAIDKKSANLALSPLLLQFEEKVPLALHCQNCCAQLVTTCSYKRLREFPSCVVHPSDFFCHNHKNGGDSSQPSLVPSPSDLFYGLNHIVLNKAVLQSTTCQRDAHLYCARCMCMLGETILNDAAAKLWADTLTCRLAESTVHSKLFKDATLTQLVLRLLHTLWPMPLSQLCLSMSKALLVSTMPDRSKKYMALHVLEPELRVLRDALPDGDWCQLRPHRACKLYFRVFDAPHVILSEWKRNLRVPNMTLSPDMFHALHTCLEQNSALIPLAWRHNTDEEQLVLTYFFYESGKQAPQQPTKRKPKQAKHAQHQLAEQLKKLSLKDYETDAGHGSHDEDESDDEHSDSDDDKSKRVKPVRLAAVVVANGNTVPQSWPLEAGELSSTAPN